MTSDPTVDITPPQYVVLHGTSTTVIVAHGAGPPAIEYWGERLDDDPSDLGSIRSRPRAHGVIDVEAPIAILPESGSGHFGTPGIEGFRIDGGGWAPRFRSADAVEERPDGVALFCIDEIAGLTLSIEVTLDRHDVLSIRAHLTNVGHSDYQLQRLAVSVPIPQHANELLDVTGRWCDEFRMRRRQWESGTFLSENRRGRTSHDQPPMLFVGSAGFTETQGEVWGLHLAWSGNARTVVERLSDGRRHVQIGELLMPGESTLGPGDTITTPWLHGAHGTGLGAVSRAFHQHLRARPSHPTPDRPRPVLLNTWEAVYFDHDLDTLKRLADAAADVGVERFVLDDGWFRGRGDDTAGLGDWFVDEQKYPDGLAPLVDHVTALGLEFGLWLEPEMVNPDSDLHRAHPDWVLADAAYPPVLGRHQLVLDLANPDAFATVLERIDSLLTDLDISYVKWDMNRDHVQAAHDGRPGTRIQTLALYRLLDALAERHPDVEIESCSSGGGRADFAILERTKRIWTSDCNDALERQRIQRGFSLLFPPELMGAHIGPPVSHTTRRTHELSLRGAIAMLGHLGIEWNLLAASAAERDQIRDVVSVHKRFRPLLHSGDVVRLDSSDDTAMAQGVVAADKSAALFCYVRTATARFAVPDPVRFAHLDPERTYRVSIVDLPGRSGVFNASSPDWMQAGVTVTGRSLMTAGLQLPVLDPESAVLLHLASN